MVTQRLLSARYTNSKGKIIPLHHAFRTVDPGYVSRVSAIVLPVFFMALVWFFLPRVLEVWAAIFDFWMQHIYQGLTGYAYRTVMGEDVLIPYPALIAGFSSTHDVWLNLIICVIVFVLSFLMPRRLAPPVYLLRAALLIQASASIDRLLSPHFFPYTLDSYLIDALTLCAYMLFLLPLLLGAIYYIFDFSIWRKCLLTLMILGYYVVAIPCQYMLHAYIIHEGGTLFLPLLYMLFGVLLDIFVFISIYAFGMSWKRRETALQGRGMLNDK